MWITSVKPLQKFQSMRGLCRYIFSLLCAEGKNYVLPTAYTHAHTIHPLIWHTHIHPLSNTWLFSDTQTKPFFFSPPEDNSCAVRWDHKRKSIYPSGAVVMTLPAGSSLALFLPLGRHRMLLCRLDGVRVVDGGGGAELAAGGPLSHHTQLFQDTGCTFDMCLLTLPMMLPLLLLPLWLGLSARLTGVMVCETGGEREYAVTALVYVHLCVCDRGKNSARETGQKERKSFLLVQF